VASLGHIRLGKFFPKLPLTVSEGVLYHKGVQPSRLFRENAMQVTFDFPKQQINIEGEELELVELLKLIRDIAPKIPAINIVAQTAQGDESLGNGGAGKNHKGGNGSGGALTMRQFVKSIVLTNISERIAAIAYYQKQHNSTPSVSPKELAEFFVQCGFQKPVQMPVAVFDAKRKYGFMESVGHGRWRVSTQGENLIVGKLEAKSEQTNAE